MTRYETHFQKSARGNDCGSACVVPAADDFYVDVRRFAAVRPRHVPKAETLRETAYELCAKLYGPNDKEPKWDDDGATQDMTFGNNDFTVKGVQLQSTKQEVKVSQNGTEKTEKYVFHRYCNKEEEGTTNP